MPPKPKKLGAHQHQIAQTLTTPGTGVYRDSCICGATRRRTYRGIGENIEPVVSDWRVGKRRANPQK